MKEWRVHVEGVGYIGTVHEHDQVLARCAALHEFSKEGNRPKGNLEHQIFEDDNFSVAEE